MLADIRKKKKARQASRKQLYYSRVTSGFSHDQVEFDRVTVRIRLSNLVTMLKAGNGSNYARDWYKSLKSTCKMGGRFEKAVWPSDP